MKSWKFYFGWALLGIIVFNFYQSYQLTRLQPFDHDEFQHIHIAWNMFQGKTLYVDFFDSHGPLFALLNLSLFKIFNLEAGLATLVFFKQASLIFECLFLLALFGLAYQVTRRITASLLACAICSSLFFFIDKASEIRPDVIQNVFWLTGLVLVFAAYWPANSLGARKFTLYSTTAGFLFGLMIQSNVKAGIGPFFLTVFLITWWLIAPARRRPIMQGLLGLAGGLLLTYLAFGLYFLTQGSLAEFLYYNYVFPFEVISSRIAKPLAKNWTYLVDYQWSFVLAMVLAILFFGRDVIRNIKNPSPALQKEALLFTLFFGTLLGAFLNLFSQYYLIFLPLAAVLATLTLEKIAALTFLKVKPTYPPASLIIIATLLLAQLVYGRSHKIPKMQDAELILQLGRTQKILKNTARDQAIGFLWNGCGGYVFNAPIDYFWLSCENLPKVFDKIADYKVFGQHYIDLLETNQTPYVIARWEESKKLSPKLHDYLKARYDHKNCMWVRKQTLAPGGGVSKGDVLELL